MQMTGLARLGKDAELRTIQSSGDKVASLSLAFNYGRKDADGKRPTQWVEGSLWGRQAEALVDYLVKGQQVVVTIDDPHLETYQGRNGEGTKLTGRISNIELAGGRTESNPQRQNAAPTQSQPPRPAAPVQRESSRPAPDDLDDDIPF